MKKQKIKPPFPSNSKQRLAKEEQAIAESKKQYRDNSSRLREIQRLRMAYQRLQIRARHIAAMFESNTPGEGSPHILEWERISSDAAHIRRRLDVLVHPSEWYLKP